MKENKRKELIYVCNQMRLAIEDVIDEWKESRDNYPSFKEFCEMNNYVYDDLGYFFETESKYIQFD